jgi:hypothetical protein
MAGYGSSNYQHDVNSPHDSGRYKNIFSVDMGDFQILFAAQIGNKSEVQRCNSPSVGQQASKYYSIATSSHLFIYCFFVSSIMR